MKKKLIFLIIIFCCLFAQVVLAVGVGVKPKEINLNVDVNERVRTEILVANVSNEPAMYTVYPDEMQGVISVEPAAFRLEAGGVQIVELVIEKSVPGKIETNLSVVAKPLGGQGLQAGSAVKIPVKVRVVGFPMAWVLVIIVCLAAGLVVVNVRKMRKTRG